MGELTVSVSRGDALRVACCSEEDELGQQWGVTCSAHEVQASVRCRAWGDVWCTPTLTMHRAGKRDWAPQCCLVVDVGL